MLKERTTTAEISYVPTRKGCIPSLFTKTNKKNKISFKNENAVTVLSIHHPYIETQFS